MEENNSRIVVELPEALKKRFKVVCIHMNVSMGEEIRKFVENWTEKVETENLHIKRKK